MECIDHGHRAPRYSVSSLGGVKAGKHRVVYCKEHGLTLADIAGKVVMHTCDNPRCINPAHLVLGTQAENMADKYRKGRGGVLRGDSHPSSITTTEQRAEIVKRAISGEPKARLADEYGISIHSVWRYLKEERCR